MTIKRLNELSLSTLVPVGAVPDKVNFIEHSFDYQGVVPEPGKLFVALHGGQSKHTALVAASAWARDKQGKTKPGQPDRMMVMDFGYHIENLKSTRANSSVALLEETGLISFDRITSDYREELREQWLEWISQDFSAQRAENMSVKSLRELAVLFPQYINKMFHENRKIHVILHPVAPMIDPRSEIWVATVRYVKNRICQPEMRFAPEIKVVL